MDALIAAWPAVRHQDLALCLEKGVAYQADMAARVAYTNEYAKKFAAYDPHVEYAVNRGRIGLVGRHLARGARVLDFGAGRGTFIGHARMEGFDAKGYEVIPGARAVLQSMGLFAHDPLGFDAMTMWDVLEHLEYPAVALGCLDKGAKLFVSLPIFESLGEIRGSKHYRPGEHLYYFTDAGFVAWIALHGFRLLERSGHEIEAGREAIGAYAFVREQEAPDIH